MKKHFLYLFVVLNAFSVASAVEHLKESRSPLMVPLNSDEMYIPGTYGGVKAVVLDLEQVGTQKMLSVLFRGNEELQPHWGEGFELYSDRIVKDQEKGSTTRYVTLLRRSSKEGIGAEVINYKIHHQEFRDGPNRVPRYHEETRYKLSISAISNHYEIPYLYTAYASTPPSARQAAASKIIENKAGDDNSE